MKTLLRNCMVWDGTGAAMFPGEVLLEDPRIRCVARGSGALAAEGAQLLDAQGVTLMPGLVEGHAHLSFCGALRSTDLGDIPPEEHTLATLHNARTLLEAGFTSAYSAASAKLRLIMKDGVAYKNRLDAGAPARAPQAALRSA